MARKDRKRKREGEEHEVSGLEKRKEVINPYIPEELEMEILLKLPVKSLIRFCCVSKRWCHVFSTHKFMSDHVRTFNEVKQDLLLFWKFNSYPKSRFPLYLDARYPDPPRRLGDLVPPLSRTEYFMVRPVGYCNGFVCLYCLSLAPSRRGEHKVDILIWNPSINKSMLVPVQRFDISPAWCVMVVGFGFTGDDLKLVTLPMSLAAGKPIELGMYSLQTGKWEMVAAASDPRSEIHSFCPGMQFPREDAVFLNQSCHWYIGDKHQVGRGFVMSFNLIDKVLRKIALPDRLAPEGCRTYYNRIGMSVYDGCLSVFGIRSHQQDDSECDLFVWVMKEYGNAESWTRIVYGKVARPADHIVGFREGGEVIYKGSYSELISCDPVIKSPRYFADFFDEYGVEAYHSNFCQMDIYKESLFLLKEGYD